MCQSGNGLHLNSVSLIKRMVQDTRGINHLPSCVLVVSVPHKQRLGCESVRLDVNICISHIVDQTRFSNVWVSCQDEGSCIGVDGRKSSQMLPNLLEIAKGRL